MFINDGRKQVLELGPCMFNRGDKTYSLPVGMVAVMQKCLFVKVFVAALVDEHRRLFDFYP